MNIYFKGLVALIGLTVATVAAALTERPHTGSGPEVVITREEVVIRALERFDAADMNSDGVLRQMEIEEFIAPGSSTRQMPEPLSMPIEASEDIYLDEE